MWGNIAARIGNVVERVKTAAQDLDRQLDAAVGLDEGGVTITASPSAAARAAPQGQDDEDGVEDTEQQQQRLEASPPLTTPSVDRYDDVSLESPQPVDKLAAPTGPAKKAAGKGKKGAESAAPAPAPAAAAAAPAAAAVVAAAPAPATTAAAASAASSTATASAATAAGLPLRPSCRHQHRVHTDAPPQRNMNTATGSKQAHALD